MTVSSAPNPTPNPVIIDENSVPNTVPNSVPDDCMSSDINSAPNPPYAAPQANGTVILEVAVDKMAQDERDIKGIGFTKGTVGGKDGEFMVRFKAGLLTENGATSFAARTLTTGRDAALKSGNTSFMIAMSGCAEMAAGQSLLEGEPERGLILNMTVLDVSPVVPNQAKKNTFHILGRVNKYGKLLESVCMHSAQDPKLSPARILLDKLTQDKVEARDLKNQWVLMFGTFCRFTNLTPKEGARPYDQLYFKSYQMMPWSNPTDNPQFVNVSESTSAPALAVAAAASNMSQKAMDLLKDVDVDF